MPSTAATDLATAMPDVIDTPHLLAQLAAGRDDRAWEALVVCHAASMRRAAQAVAGHTALADDAVQEALLQVRDRAYLYQPTGADPERSAEAWLRRIAATCALQLLRSERRRTRHERAAEESAMRTQSPTVHDALAESELRHAVMTELAALPQRHREPIVLHLLVGLDHAAVGAHIGCSEATARVRLHRAIAHLRKRLSAHDGTAGVNLVALVDTIADTTPSQNRLTAWRELLQSTARPRLSQLAVFGGARWQLRVLLLCLLTLLGGVLLRGADQASALAPVKPVAAVAARTRTPNTAATAEVDSEVMRALDARINLVLKRDTLSDTVRFIDAQLLPNAEVWWRMPDALAMSGRLLISDEPHETVRAFLDQIAKGHGLRWEPRAYTVILWKPLPAVEVARIESVMDSARRQHDVRAWSEAAQEALASGDLELRRDIVRTVAEVDQSIAVAARHAALQIGAERVAAEFSGDGLAGTAMLSWMHSDSTALAEPSFWGLWVDVHPKDGLSQCLTLIDLALTEMKGPAAGGARRVAALSLAAAARAATSGQLGAVAARIGRCVDLDVAIEALCLLARRNEPTAVSDCRQLAAGTIDHQRWTTFTSRQNDAKQALMVLRYRPSLELPPGWWHQDPRFGDNGVIDDLRQCPFNPLYQEPAIDALVAIHDPEVLNRLTQCVAAIDSMKETSANINVNGMGSVKMRTGDEVRLSVAQEQAMRWLAVAGVTVDLQRLLRLVDVYECFDLAGPGAPDLLLRLVRAGTRLGVDDQRRLDAALFKQAQSLGGMMEVGTPNRYLPWLAHFNALDDPGLIAPIRAELEKRDYHGVVALGSGGGQYGFPIYQRLAQALATMRTPSALAALRSAKPQWVQQPDDGLSYWYLALGYTHDADCTKALLDTVQAGGPLSGFALAALAAARDPAAMDLVAATLPTLTGQQRGWCMMNLMQDGIEWAPMQTTAVLIAAVGRGDALTSKLALEELGHVPRRPCDEERTTAAVTAAKFLITVITKADSALASEAISSLAHTQWPSALDDDIGGALAHVVRESPDPSTRKVAAHGLVALRGDSVVRGMIAHLLTEVTDPLVHEALMREAGP